MSVKDNYISILKQIPFTTMIILAAKTRTKEEILEAIDAGAADIGYNYVQEAETMHKSLGDHARKLRWHLIGHLQKNKVSKALAIFDMIQTIDSLELAEAISKRRDKDIDVMIEVNSGKEPSKSGVFPEDAEGLIRQISQLPHIKVKGLMTMAPDAEDADAMRPYFKETRALFERLGSLSLPNVSLEYLSMGMSDSYKIAIEEGANMVRIGSAIFGDRKQAE